MPEIQWRVWCQGVVGSSGWGSGGCSVCGGWTVWVVLRLVWKRQRVVGVALQGADAVVMRTAQGVADGVGQQRVRADLDEGAVLGAGRGDGLAEPHRVAQVGRPILGVETGTRRSGVVTVVMMTGMVGRLRRQIRPAPNRNSGSIGSMIG